MPEHRRWTGLAVLILCLAGAPGRADVATGVEAWEAGDHPKALSEWRPLANRGNATAQFNMGQAYRFGRGVPADSGIARSWYEKAAQQGHQQAQAALGLLLYQAGDRTAAIYWIRKAAERDNPRAQYVLGLAHFNGDGVSRDWPRAHALMSRAATAGIAEAAAALKQMDRHMLLANKEKDAGLARQAAAAGDTATATVALAPATLPRLPLEPAATADLRVLSAPAPAPPPAKRAADPKPAKIKSAATVAAQVPAADGRWRVQLGAYGNEAEARSRWNAITGRVKALGGLTPSYERFGRYTRLRAGPVGAKTDASRLCASAKASGQDCFVVSP
jgi:cell division septation protein DedD